MDKIRNMKIAGILKESVDLDYKLKLPSEIEIIKNAFSRLDYKIYVVGGAVRDALLNKVPKDFDLATNATPEEVKMILDKFGIKNFPKGEQFGVVSAIINGEEFEIATFRTDMSYDTNDLNSFLKFLKKEHPEKYNVFVTEKLVEDINGN